MFKKILIANRGEIACRIIRTAQKMGITCVAIYSEIDKQALHVQQADEAYLVGNAPALESYLNIPNLLTIAKKANVDAIHPGYGFLSENPDFAKACTDANICFIGPPFEAIKAMASKSDAKQQMQQAGVPVIPGYHGSNQDPKQLAQEANHIGYPLLIKAAAGGGGKGMRIVENANEFQAALESAKREALKAFHDEQIILEKYLPSPRHIEIQIFADQFGQTVHLFERDCSIQRRYQKVIEETPAPHFSAALRKKMTETAILAAKTVHYVGAGTIEFLLDGNQFYFMEMNTRLQVEHPITEKITGIDLVEWQLRIASGESLPLQQSEISHQGHAIEARVYAEDPNKNFLPTTGQIDALKSPPENINLRIDTGIQLHDRITPYYDGLLSKIITWGKTRDAAIKTLQNALDDYQLSGITTNLSFLKQLIQQNDYKEGNLHTHFIETHFTPIKDTLSNQNDATNDDPYSPWNLKDHWRLHGQTFLENTTVVEKTETTSPTEKNIHAPSALKAPLPGTIVALLAKEGEIVETGSTLVIIEAMKMEHPLRAPSKGIVKSWRFAVGDLVEEGAELLVFEPI